MPRARSLAAGQTIPVRGDIGANVAEHVRLARLAARERAEVIVFPELSLLGYELDLAANSAFSENDPRLAPLAEVAAAFSMMLVVGAPVRIGPRLHIGAFILFPNRSVELYTKHYLGAFPSEVSPAGKVPPPEPSVFEPGDRNPLLRFHGNTAAVAVCADTGHASHPRAAAERGAKSYFASMFITPSELEQETTRLGAYAARHSMAVVAANFGGPSGGLPAAGGSAIWSEAGELLVQLERSGAGVAVAIEHETGFRVNAVMLDAERD